MAINKKLININRASVFNSMKLSANVDNTQYTVGPKGTPTVGAPDIKFQSICFINDSKQIWTHGTLYGGGEVIPYGSTEYDDYFVS